MAGRDALKVGHRRVNNNNIIIIIESLSISLFLSLSFSNLQPQEGTV